MLTRRCTQRTLLLRPDEETNQIFLYCLAVAAKKHEIDVLFSLVMSNHHHTIIYDRNGTVAEFMEYLHGMVARSMNCLRGRWENFWAKEEPGRLSLEELPDVLSKLAYAATNPVKSHLVERAEQWPGFNTTEAFFSGASLTAVRPKHYFSEDGELPEEVTLTLSWPEHLGSVEVARGAVRERIDAIEARARQERVSARQTVLGARAARRQDFNSRPRTEEPRRGVRPRVAACNAWARVEALRRNRVFVAAYRVARALWLEGREAIFPPGTYLMRRFPGVVVRE